MSFARQYKNGFSLVEMLVYIALFLIVSTAAVTTLLTFSESARAYAVDRLLLREAQPAMMRIHNELRQGTTVSLAPSVLNTTPGAITFTQGSTTVEVSLSGGQLMVERGGVGVLPLHGDAVTADALWIYHYDNTETELVRVKAQFSATAFGVTRVKTYETAAVLRGSYE